MGKRKVTDKDIRSIEFAIDSVFPGASGEVILCQEKVQIKNDFFPSCQHT